MRYLGWAVPEAVYVDFDVIASAPAALNRAGVGDILCYHTAHWDWRAARDARARTSPAGRTTTSSPQRANSSTASSGALDDIHDVNEQGIRTLMEAHRWGGAAFHDAGWNPRHIEGVEHFLFYSLERLTGRHFIHGQPVGLGIVLRVPAPGERARTDARGACSRRRRHPARGHGRDVGRRRGGDALPRRFRARGRPVALDRRRAARDDTIVAEVRDRIEAAYGQWEQRREARDQPAAGLRPRVPRADGRTAWARTVERHRQAEALGFESLWINDHFQVDPPVIDAPIFEPFVELAGIAAVTSRARLGHLVLAAAYRPAGLTAKMISTLDVIAGGRAELGIGAGWKEDEWRAYGYGFPDAPERLAILADHLEVISRMLGPGHATWAGRYASVDDAIHEPKSAGARIPILIGGNGPKVTWRLAARFADELNLDAMLPDQVEQAMPVIAARCAEIGRDPSTLRVSVHVWGRPDAPAGAPRRERLRAFRDVGVARVMLQGFGAVSDPGLLDRIADDCAAVGLLGADSGA